MTTKRKRKPWRKVYMLKDANGPMGKAELISDGDGFAGYLRFESRDGTYLGCIQGASMMAMAKSIMGSRRSPAHPEDGKGDDRG